MSVLCPSEGYYHQRQRQPLTLLQRGQTLLKLVARWLPSRPMVVVADSSFSALAFFDAVGRMSSPSSVPAPSLCRAGPMGQKFDWLVFRLHSST